MRLFTILLGLATLSTAGCGAPDPSTNRGSTARSGQPATESAVPEETTQQTAELATRLITAQEVRELEHPFDGCLSNYIHYERWKQAILRWGERAFPAYEAILTDPDCSTSDFAFVCLAIRKVNTDRSRFIPILTKLISVRQEIEVSDRKRTNLHNAISLLGEIGDDRYTAVLVLHLSGNDRLLVDTSASTLARIGGKRDLEALDRWLKKDNLPRTGNIILHVKKCRDELEQRLKDNPVPKYLIN